MFGHAGTNGKVAGGPSGCASLDLILEAEPVSVCRARRAVAEWVSTEGAGVVDLDRIRLAVSEAVTNAVVHAYGAERKGPVRVTAGLGAGELTILVADQGCGIGSAPESPGLGLGLGVIEESCESLTITTRAGGGLQLEMRFALERCGEHRRFRDRAAQARGSVVSAMRAASPHFSTTT